MSKGGAQTTSRNRFKRYPAYKDSGVEWLGAIPAHWEVKRVKHVSSIGNSGAYGVEAGEAAIDLPVCTTAHVTPDGRFLVENMPLRGFSISEASRYTGKPGDLFIVKSSGSNTNIISGKLALITEDTQKIVFSNFLMRIRPSPRIISSPFLAYLLSSQLTRERIQRMVATTTYPNIDVPDYVGSAVAIPRLGEQHAIAAFLDREAAKIDALVAKKERLIELLQEKRTVLITRTVTKGLDLHIPMKDSSVEWLGKIPAHWHLKRLKHVCDRVFVGIAEAATFAYVEDGVPMLRSTDVRANRIRTDDIRRIDRRFADRLRSKMVKTGDIVTVRTGNAGVSAVVPPEYDEGQCFTLVVSRPARRHDSRYFCYWLNVPPGQQQFAVEGMGAAQINISVPIVQNTIVCVPSPEEQGRIADWIEQQVTSLDALTVTIRNAIYRLKEFRTALISAAVTGKIDVREEVA